MIKFISNKTLKRLCTDDLYKLENYFRFVGKYVLPVFVQVKYSHLDVFISDDHVVALTIQDHLLYNKDGKEISFEEVRNLIELSPV